MAITAMIAGAVATFSLAVSQNWRVEQRTQRLAIGAEVIASRLRDVIVAARLVGGCETGSLANGGSAAGILLWTEDSNSDGLIQGSETALLYFDPATHQLLLYRGNAAETSTWSYANAFMPVASVDAYRSLRSCIPIANNVNACCIQSTGNSLDGTSRISFAFQLKTQEGTQTESIVHYCDAALRAPASIPSN